MTYEARPIKRSRASKQEMLERENLLFSIVEAHQPASVRHAYYLAVVDKVPSITKNDSGYNKVQRALVKMRRGGNLPFEWIVDNTRWMRRPRSFSDAEECVFQTAQMYRRNLWSNRAEVVEVWAESDSIAGVIADVTSRWNVPLMVTRGFSSITFAHAAVSAWNDAGRDVVVYYIGDHDPDGLAIEKKLISYIHEWQPNIGVSWERIGVTWDQVEQYDLPGSPPNKEYGFPLAVEAEALPPDILRELLDEAIASHVNPDDLAIHEMIEAEERQMLRGLTGMLDAIGGGA